MRFTGLDTAQLLRDPSQQVAYGYVSGNPLAWTDWLGLCDTRVFIGGHIGYVGHEPTSWERADAFNIVTQRKKESSEGVLKELGSFVAGEVVDRRVPSGTTLSGYTGIGGEIAYQSITGSHNESAMFGAVTGGAASVVATGVVVTVGAPVVVGGIVVIGAGLVGGYIGSTVYDSIVPPGIE